MDERLAAELYARHARRVYNLALRFAPDPTRAEDLTQEVFLRILAKAHTFRRGSDPEPWVIRVATSVFLNHRPRRPDPRPLEGEPPERPGVAPERLEEARELLARLPAKQRLLFLLVHYESNSAAEAAALTGLRPSTVRSHLKRARRTLARFLDGRRTEE